MSTPPRPARPLPASVPYLPHDDVDGGSAGEGLGDEGSEEAGDAAADAVFFGDGDHARALVSALDALDSSSVLRDAGALANIRSKPSAFADAAGDWRAFLERNN